MNIKIPLEVNEIYTHTHKSVYGSYDKHTCKYALQPLILLIGTYTGYICTTYDPT